MNDLSSKSYTSFDGHRLLAVGTPGEVALAVKRALANGANGPVLTYDDATGRVVDIDTRGSDDEVRAFQIPRRVERTNGERGRE